MVSFYAVVFRCAPILDLGTTNILKTSLETQLVHTTEFFDGRRFVVDPTALCDSQCSLRSFVSNDEHRFLWKRF